MEQYEYIRSGSRVYGKSIRGLVRETGHARNTVRKALRSEYQGYSQRQQLAVPCSWSLSWDHRQMVGRGQGSSQEAASYGQAGF